MKRCISSPFLHPSCLSVKGMRRHESETFQRGETVAGLNLMDSKRTRKNRLKGKDEKSTLEKRGDFVILWSCLVSRKKKKWWWRKRKEWQSVSLLLISTNFLSSHTFSPPVLLYVKFIFERLSLLGRETERRRRGKKSTKEETRRKEKMVWTDKCFFLPKILLFSPLSFLVISFLCKFSLQTFLSLPLFWWPYFFPSQKLMNHSSFFSSSSYLSLVMYGFKGEKVGSWKKKMRMKSGRNERES